MKKLECMLLLFCFFIGRSGLKKINLAHGQWGEQDGNSNAHLPSQGRKACCELCTLGLSWLGYYWTQCIGKCLGVAVR